MCVCVGGGGGGGGLLISFVTDDMAKLIVYVLLRGYTLIRKIELAK